MIYFLLILALDDSIYIESYPTRIECEIRREVVWVEQRIKSTCLRVETKERV